MFDKKTLLLLNNYSGQHGITNFGTTCFINAVLQCLCHLPQLLVFFLSGAAMAHIKFMKKKLKSSGNLPAKNHIPRIPGTTDNSLLLVELFDDFIKLLRINRPDRKIISPQKLMLYIEQLSVYKYKNGMLNEPFVRVNMGDSHEFLTFILDQLHEELKIPVNMEINTSNSDQSPYSKFHQKSLETFKSNFQDSYSVIIDIFYGQFGLQIYNPVHKLTNGICRMTFDPFNTLTLTFPQDHSTKHFTLVSLLDFFFEETKQNYTLQDDHGSDQTNMKLKQCFWTLPKVLIIHIKRYSANNQKINGCSVLFPEILDVSSYYRTGFHKNNEKNEDVDDEKSIVKTRYSLIGCIHHIGNSIQGGHYFADCKNVHSHWCRYDDTSVTPMEFQSILDTSSHTVYQLFYFKL